MESKPAPSPARPIPAPEYHHSLRAQPNRALRSTAALGLVTCSMTATVMLISPFTTLINGFLNPHVSLSSTKTTWTSGLLVAANLLPSLQIPAAIIIERYVYHQPHNSISSTHNRFRWPWLLHLAKRIVPISLAAGAALQCLNPAGWPSASPSVLSLSLFLALTMPLATAAEEYVVRGILQRIVSSWFASPEKGFWVSTAVASVFFAGIHVPRTASMAAYCALASVVASLMTRWSGGLEASTLLHTVSNVVLMWPALAAGNAGWLEKLVEEGTPGGIVAVACVNVVGSAWVVWREVERDWRGGKEKEA